MPYNVSAPVMTYTASDIDSFANMSVKTADNRTVVYGAPASVLEYIPVSESNGWCDWFD